MGPFSFYSSSSSSSSSPPSSSPSYMHYILKFCTHLTSLNLERSLSLSLTELLRDRWRKNFNSNRRESPPVADPGEFSMIEDLGSLAKKMVETGKNTVFALVYRLIELALVLPVTTVSVERVFSAMKIIKTDLRNRMGEEWMNDSLIVYIEKEIFATIENEQILQHFQQMNTRRTQLSSLVCTQLGSN